MLKVRAVTLLFVAQVCLTAAMCGTITTPNDQVFYKVPGQENALRVSGATVSLVVTARAANDAHVALLTQQPDDPLVTSSAAYHIVISGWGNAKSAIRREIRGANQAIADTPSLLDQNGDQTFWLSTSSDTGRVALGQKVASSVRM